MSTPSDDAGPTERVRQFRFRPAPGSCDLLLIRHGESMPTDPDDPFPTVDGHSDPPLDPQGHEEAARVAERLAGEEVSAIYVTTLQRTQQTAQPLADKLGLQPRVEADLREVHLGDWEGGLFRFHVRERHPTAMRLLEEGEWSVIPGAESNEDFAARVQAGIERIAEAHPDQRVVAFVHGGVIGMAMSLATGASPLKFAAAANGSLNHLVIDAPDDGRRRWILRRFNDTGHLATDLDRPVQPLQ